MIIDWLQANNTPITESILDAEQQVFQELLEEESTPYGKVIINYICFLLIQKF